MIENIKIYPNFNHKVRIHIFWNIILTNNVSFLAITGGVGIGNMVEKMENEEYMGFDNLCHHGKKYGV